MQILWTKILIGKMLYFREKIRNWKKLKKFLEKIKKVAFFWKKNIFLKN